MYTFLDKSYFSRLFRNQQVLPSRAVQFILWLVLLRDEHLLRRLIRRSHLSSFQIEFGGEFFDIINRLVLFEKGIGIV